MGHWKPSEDFLNILYNDLIIFLFELLSWKQKSE